MLAIDNMSAEQRQNTDVLWTSVTKIGGQDSLVSHDSGHTFWVMAQER